MNVRVGYGMVKLWPQEETNKYKVQKEVYYTHRSQRGVTYATQGHRGSIRFWTGGRRQE